MINFVIIGLVLAGLAVHRYLSTFWEQGLLPHYFGFIIFANAFWVTYLISFIWMFGLLVGVIVTALCCLQIVYSAGLWITSLPWLINMRKGLSAPRVNLLVYGCFSFLVIAIALLTIVNFFVSSYKSMWAMMGEGRGTAVVVFAAVLVAGNVARVAIMSKLLKE